MALAPLTHDRREWLADLYKSHQAAVYRLCLRILRDPNEAEDACHEVFIRAAGASDSKTLATNARPWLLTVARNHSLDLVRRRKRLGKALTTMGGTLNDASDPQAVVVDRQILISVFTELAPRERTVLWQSAGERRALADIAEGLRLNYMAAAQVLSRARRHAAFAASRVAAILGLLPLYRLLRRVRLGEPLQVSLNGTQLAALAAVPLLVIAIQSSSSADQRQSNTLVVASTTVHAESAAGRIRPARSAESNQPSLTAPTPVPARPSVQLPGSPVTVPSDANSTITQLTNAIRSITHNLPPAPTALPSPSLPPPPKLPH